MTVVVPYKAKWCNLSNHSPTNPSCGKACQEWYMKNLFTFMGIYQSTKKKKITFLNVLVHMRNNYQINTATAKMSKIWKLVLIAGL